MLEIVIGERLGVFLGWSRVSFPNHVVLDWTFRIDFPMIFIRIWVFIKPQFEYIQIRASTLFLLYSNWNIRNMWAFETLYIFEKNWKHNCYSNQFLLSSMKRAVEHCRYAWLHHSMQFFVYFVAFVTIFLRWGGFARSQEAVVDQGAVYHQTVTVNFLWCNAEFEECLEASSWSNTGLNIVDCSGATFFCHISQYVPEKHRFYCVKEETITFWDDEIADVWSSRSAPYYQVLYFQIFFFQMPCYGCVINVQLLRDCPYSIGIYHRLQLIPFETRVSSSVFLEQFSRVAFRCGALIVGVNDISASTSLWPNWSGEAKRVHFFDSILASNPKSPKNGVKESIITSIAGGI